MNAVLRPRRMLYPQVTGISYIVVSDWWMYSFYSAFTETITSLINSMALLSLLVTVAVWFGCSWWLVKRNNA
jgi:hypothetical protein